MSNVNRHERRRRETADRILAAAAELFGEQGVQATKVADICERADVAQQTFFNHFPAKQDVVGELARRGHDLFLAVVEGARREGRDCSRLRSAAAPERRFPCPIRSRSPTCSPSSC